MLATGNNSEVLRGYYTKYDNSSGDYNLVGSLNKQDIWAIMRYAAERDSNFNIIEQIANAAPTAQLRPSTDNDT